jgi:hypothetical protein
MASSPPEVASLPAEVASLPAEVASLPAEVVRSHGQSGQPFGQVPLFIAGSTHCGPMNTGSGTVQQSIPVMQHCVPQQSSVTGQLPPLQGGVPHCPLLQ